MPTKDYLAPRLEESSKLAFRVSRLGQQVLYSFQRVQKGATTAGYGIGASVLVSKSEKARPPQSHVYRFFFRAYQECLSEPALYRVASVAPKSSPEGRGLGRVKTLLGWRRSVVAD